MIWKWLDFMRLTTRIYIETEPKLKDITVLYFFVFNSYPSLISCVGIQKISLCEDRYFPTEHLVKEVCLGISTTKRDDFD